MKNKTKFCSQKNSQNCFFLLEPVRCHFMTKFWSDLAHVSILDPKQFQIFLIFFCFFEFTIHQADIFVFYHELLECRKRTKFCSHLAYESIFDPKKFQIFLNFFLSNLLFIGRFCCGQNRSTCSKSGLGPNLSGFET